MGERFSDEKLQELYQDVVDQGLALKRHQKQFDEYRMEQQKLHNELLGAIKDNTSAVANVAEAVSALSIRTEGIIDVWDASQGALKTAKAIGGSVKWVSIIVASVSSACATAWYVITHLEWPK